jgi:hypothetical protein
VAGLAAGAGLVAGPAAWLLARPAEAAGSDALVTARADERGHGALEAAVERRLLVRGPRIRFEVGGDRPRDGRARRSAPRAVAIPAIGLRAPLRPVGVDGARALELPENARTAGWYRFGPVPGEPGTAVVAAHVDRAGAPAAFFDLRRVGPGDRVVVSFRGGREVFEVVARKRYGKGDLPDRLFARDGRPALALVTCAGEFDERTRSYADNLVVWALPRAP